MLAFTLYLQNQAMNPIQDWRKTMRTLFMLLAFLMALLPPSAAFCWSESTIVTKDQTSSYAVQVQRFADAASAQALADALRQKDQTPHVLGARGTDGAIWYAVRLGLYDSLDAAMEAAREYNESEGGGAVVAITGKVDALEADNQLYFLQVGAFVEQANARERQKVYREKGYDAGIVKLYDNEKDHWYIVFTERFDNPDAAHKAADVFREKEGQPCYVNVIDATLFPERAEAENP
jgi:cell division septation protein DedD